MSTRNSWAAQLRSAVANAMAAVPVASVRRRNPVLETDHIIILNWNPAVFDLIGALAIANAARSRPRIVIMADRNSAEMEAEIAARLPSLGKMRVSCRQGDPTDLFDLRLTAPQAARSIIVLAPEPDDARAGAPDSAVINTLLALTHDPRHRPAPYRITAEIRHAATADLAPLVGGAELHLVPTDALLARILVQAARQPGLSQVYAELLDFSGHTIQVLNQPDLVGNVFGDSLMAYEGSTLIGLRTPDGAVSLNPPMDTVITPGTQAILLAEAAATVRIATANITVDLDAIHAAAPRLAQSERTLMLGWNRRAKAIAYHLSRSAAPGSVLAIAADTPALDADIATLAIVSDTLAVAYGKIDTTDRQALESLDLASYDHVLVLAAPDQPGDTRPLITLLHLRQIADTTGVSLNIVSEMLDARNSALVEFTRPDDIVVSNTLVSLLLAQASENDALAAILAELFDETEPELCLRPAEAYIALGAPTNFYTITQAARERDEVALGYHRPRSGAVAGGIVLNPPKARALDYQPGDRLIVLART